MESITTYQNQEPVAVVRTWSDRLGICLSALCVIHCALMPVLVFALPALQFTAVHEFFHHGLLLVLPVLAVAAFIPGFKKHRDARVFYWSIPGLALIAIASIAFDHDALIAQGLVTISGSLLLIRAHLINRRLCACCETGHGHGAVAAPRRLINR